MFLLPEGCVEIVVAFMWKTVQNFSQIQKTKFEFVAREMTEVRILFFVFVKSFDDFALLSLFLVIIYFSGTA